MKAREIERALGAANPVGRRALPQLPPGPELDELLAEITAEPSEAGFEPMRPAPPQRRGRPRYLLGIAGAAVAVAILLVVIGGSGGSTQPPARAYGAELVRFAQASPLLLLEAPGWEVAYADEEAAEEGELRFQHGSESIPTEHASQAANGEITGILPAATRQRQAELSWRGGSLAGWVKDRAASAEARTTAPVLGTTAKVFQYEGGSPGDLDVTALWLDQDRVLEFRSEVPTMAAFKQRLASLRRVSPNAWLDAMPASVVKAADHGATVAEMLVGIQLPPGFDPAQIPDAGLIKDRYQLGATVAGTVACTWFRDWGRARARGDEAGVKAAVAAMASAEDWPILREMEAEGAYPQVVEEFAAAMPSGEWFGRPLLGDVNSGLGCTGLGVPLSG